MGSVVKVYDEELDETEEYNIVGSNEVDAMANKISDMSPIGKALIGKKAGDTVVVDAPGGAIKLKIVEVGR